MSDKEEKKDKLEFKEFFRFTKDGRMKSGTLAYSISLAALYLIVYGAAYYFSIDILAPMTNSLPAWAANLISAIVPALFGAIILLIPVKLLYDRRWALYGYIWTFAFAVLFLAAMVISLKDEPDALNIFLRLFLIMVPAPIILGSGSTWMMYKNQIKKEVVREGYD